VHTSSLPALREPARGRVRAPRRTRAGPLAASVPSATPHVAPSLRPSWGRRL
jgi:hypothetical protein